MKRWMLTIVFLLILSLTACGQAPDVQDPEPQNDTLILAGLSDQALELTLQELKELESISGEANTINSDNEEALRSYTGVRVETILEHFGLSLENVAAIEVQAGDGYGVQIPQQILDTRDLILAWELDGALLEGKDAPLRMVVPEERTLYWVRNVVQLDFVTAAVAIEVDQVVFFENLLPGLNTEVYTYYGSEDHAVNIRGLDVSDEITMVARDGLTKYENLKPSIDYYIKVDGEDSPQFISPSISKGMYVKELGLLLTDSRAIVFAGPFLQGDKVDMEGVMELLAPYLAEGPVTLTLPQGDLDYSAADLAGLELVVTDQGVALD